MSNQPRPSFIKPLKKQQSLQDGLSKAKNSSVNNTTEPTSEINLFSEPLPNKLTTLNPKKESNGLNTSSNLHNSFNIPNNLHNSYNTIENESEDEISETTNNSSSQEKRVKISLREELDEMMKIAVWLDQQVKLQMENEISNLRAKQKKIFKTLKSKEKRIEELERENHWLKSQLDHTKGEKDTLIKRLNIETEFSQIILNIDEDEEDLRKLDFIKFPKPLLPPRSRSLSNITAAKLTPTINNKQQHHQQTTANNDSTTKQ